MCFATLKMVLQIFDVVWFARQIINISCRHGGDESRDYDCSSLD